MKKKSGEKKPTSPEIKRTWMTCVTAFICVLALSFTVNSIIGKICNADVEAAKAKGNVSSVSDVDAPESEGEYIEDASENVDGSQNNEPVDADQTPTDTNNTSDSASVKNEQTNVKTTAKAASTGKTTAEIVGIYNTAANKIKTNAKSITRNYSKMQSLPEYLQLPSAINSLGSWAINKFVKGSDEPVTFSSKEDIVTNFPVGGENYTSHLTSDMVKSATIKDTGKTYEISLVLYNDKLTSPKKGTGYAGVFNTVSASTFEEISVPGTKFESVKINGINGKIQCTVDKATGHITSAIYTNTDVLNLGVKVAGSNMTVKFALACENSYSIKY